MVRADGVDGVIIGQRMTAVSYVYNQTEQEPIATNKKNSISDKFHKTLQHQQQ